MPSICSQSSPSTPSPLMMPLHCFLLLFFQETPLLFIFFSVELFILCYFNLGGLTVWHMGSQSPNQGSNLCPLHWKCTVLTTAPQGSPSPSILHSRNKRSSASTWPASGDTVRNKLIEKFCTVKKPVSETRGISQG